MKATNEANVFGLPLLGFSNIGLPGINGSEQALARTRERLEKIKAASEEMTEALRENYSSNARSATDYGLKVLELSSVNTVSALDFMIHLYGSKSATDAFELSAKQTRKAFDTASHQTSELWALSQKLANETGEPMRKRFSKALRQAN
jgi:hypothetical protein